MSSMNTLHCTARKQLSLFIQSTLIRLLYCSDFISVLIFSTHSSFFLLSWFSVSRNDCRAIFPGTSLSTYRLWCCTYRSFRCLS